MSELHKHAAVFKAAMRGELDEWETNRTTLGPTDWNPARSYLDVLYSEPEKWNSRRKKKTHVVNGFTVPEPLKNFLAETDRFFVEQAASKCFFAELYWNNDQYQQLMICRGIAHATKEGAIANCKARLGIDPYKDKS